MKRIGTYVLLLLLSAVSCVRTPEEAAPAATSDGLLQLDFSVTTPDMAVVSTRSVDPDGLGVQSMSLLCFDRDGLFLSRVTPKTLEVNPDLLTGRFTAEVPGRTQIIHFLANQNLESTFNDTGNRGRHENSVILEQLSTSSRIVYWSRVSSVQYDSEGVPSDGDLAATLQASPVMLVRNMAKISFAQGSTEVDGTTIDIPFTVTSFTVCNQNSFGTVAPYDSQSGSFLWTPESFYVTLPQDLSKSTDPDDVNTSSEEYVFEHANASTDPLYVVVKGRNAGETEDLYYRMLLLDNATQEPLPIVRNHHYRLIVKGRLTGGVKTFSEAKTAPPVNNVWISVDQEIPAVSNGTSTLTVEQTSYIFKDVTESRRETLRFTCTGVSAGERPQVRWVSNGISSTTDFSANYTFDSSTGAGTVSITLLPVSSGEMRSGELMIKYGKLQRTIKLYSVSQFQFMSCWVSMNVDAHTSGEADARQVVLMFQLPENLPAELLPLDILISANDLNSIAAQPLRVVFRNDYLDSGGNPTEEWGRDDLWDYKYVYTVTEEMLAESPRQRIYFHATMEADESDLTSRIVIENPYFTTVDKEFTYTLNPVGMIEVNNLTTDPVSGVSYLLAPPRANEEIALTFTLPKGISAENQFEICTECLTGDGMTQTDGTLTEVTDGSTGTEGRVLLFTPDASKVNSADGNPADPVTLTVYLQTRTARFDEPIRIAGRTVQSSVPTHLDYKSTVFELSARYPFEFDMTVGNSAGGKLQMDYADTGTELDVVFSLRAKTGLDGVAYSPVGKQFTCYIEAPMLRLPENHAANVTELETGLFAYTVPASAEEGEVRIPFVTRSIVSEGTVRIYTDDTQIEFEPESVVVENNRLTGALAYRTSDGISHPVPSESFVVFERLTDGTRIGVLTVTSEGVYSLRLRSEYAYTWAQTPLRIYYRIESGTETGVYAWAGADGNGFTLSELMSDPDVELSPLTE